MCDNINLCTETILDNEESFLIAINERKDNLLFEIKKNNLKSEYALSDDHLTIPAYEWSNSRIHNEDLKIFFPHGRFETNGSIYYHAKTWKSGTILDVSISKKTPSNIKEKIIKYANEWAKHINIKFNFFTHGENGKTGVIRIKTLSDGSGSRSDIGTDAIYRKNTDEATMALDIEHTHLKEKDFAHIILHEFGHVLGAAHEVQRPDITIPWNKEKVYTYYKKEFKWDRPTVDKNIFSKYNSSHYNASEYDRYSIMHYNIPRDLIKEEYEWENYYSSKLSDKDIAFIKKMYT